MGMPVIGTVANIEGFTRQDLVRHVQTHYVGEKTVVVAAGNFDVPAWLEQAAQLFAGMPASADPAVADRKSTRLNSSHLVISYAVFCLKKKTNRTNPHTEESQQTCVCIIAQA